MNKLIAVTGGTKGIGRAIVDVFAGQNFDVITCARSQKDLKSLQENHRQTFPESEIKAIQADISSQDGVSKFIAGINQFPKRLDVLVNNAGVFTPGGVINEEEGVLEHTMRTNVFSAYYITRGVIDQMMSRGAGHIFNICSTASIMAYPNGASYCMSKFALLGFSKVLREETKKNGIRVTAVIPGPTYTSSWGTTDIPKERFIDPKDVGQLVFDAWKASSKSVVEELVIRPQAGDLN